MQPSSFCQKTQSESDWLHVEKSPRRVRVKFGGTFVVDSRRVYLVREPMRIPLYFFPKDDVRMECLVPANRTGHHPRLGATAYWTLRVGGKAAENGAWSYPKPLQEFSSLRDCLAFEWDAMDAWYEEDEEVFVHARDPYKRVDVLKSTRHVRVVVGGETVAETHRPSLLFETGMPVRYYIPQEDVRMDLLEPTDTEWRCPYKGIAGYWSVKAGGSICRDVAWSYSDPIPECAKIKDLLCFFNEKVDALYVDDELMPRPLTPWS